MKYTVFKVENNRADGIANVKSLGRLDSEIGFAIVDMVMEHQETANERHNAAMLEKDIVIARLEGQLEILKSNR